MRRVAIAFALALVRCGPALAQQLPKPRADPMSGREEFLAAAIAAMTLFSLLSFLLSGRVSERVSVALVLLGVLTGGFAMLVLFGGSLYENPIAAVLVLLLLVGMFRLMSYFESSRKPDRKQPKP